MGFDSILGLWTTEDGSQVVYAYEVDQKMDYYPYTELPDDLVGYFVTLPVEDSSGLEYLPRKAFKKEYPNQVTGVVFDPR